MKRKGRENRSYKLLMEKFRIEEKLALYSDALQNFFIKYKNILLIGVFVGIFINAVDIFTFKFGIDSEIYAIAGNKPYFEKSRYGSWILYYLFPFARYHIISQITGIIALTLAALLTISRHNISNTAKLIFVLLFVTYPNFSFLQYFYFQSAYNFIGLLFVVIAYRLIENNKNIYIYLVAIVLLFIGISSYQVNFAVFLTVMMINVILDYINDSDRRKVFTNIAKASVLLCISILLYYIIVNIFSDHLSGYHVAMFRYGRVDFLKVISDLFTNIWYTLVSGRNYSSHTANVAITIMLGAIIIYLIYKSFKKRDYLFYIFLIILWLMAIFSVNILLGNILFPRAMLTIAFYPSFVFLIFLMFSKKYTYKFVLIIAALCVMIFHSYYITKYQTAYKLSYEQDKVVAQDLIRKIYDKYPETYNGKYKKIVFWGELPQKDPHPLRQGKGAFSRGSFFHGGTARPNRMLKYSQLFGFPMDIRTVELTKEMKGLIKKMPSYPDKDCVTLFEDTIIVKLN